MFTTVQWTNNGHVAVLQNGVVVEVSRAELELASRRSGFVEQGFEGDVAHANFVFATMAKNKQLVLGYASYDAAVASLNDGEDPREAVTWIGIPPSRVVMLTNSDIAGSDSIVAWNRSHAVFIDQKSYGVHFYDNYGNEVPYVTERRRVRLGPFRFQERQFVRYPFRFGFLPQGANVPLQEADYLPMMNPMQETVVRFDHNRWQESLDAAFKFGRPLVIKVGATWCGPCQVMKNSFQDDSVRRIMHDAVFVEVELDRRHESPEAQRHAKKLSQNLKVTTYPTTLVVVVSKDNAGQYRYVVIAKQAGMLNNEQLTQFLSHAFAKAGKLRN